MSDLSKATLLKQGAEAKIYVIDFLGKPCIVKERFQKTYRHPDLDKSLTAQRTKSEIRSMLRCRTNGIRTPVIYFVDQIKNLIYMEYIQDSVTVRDYVTAIQNNPDGDTHLLEALMQKVGSTLATMHEKNIIHGDLTTSNMLLRNPPEELNLILIDFGLGYIENLAEDKGVDLYVLERAFLSTHPNTEALFELLLQSYAKDYGKGAVEVLRKLDEVRQRGRKRTMVG
ncbi:TP53-regulating kinase-like [Lingula anatina]|uniref:non-specific serine/threonine protein kinase n=1 Tax=Lingula anatina TaxID=7574 RepID=A0A1S3H2B9_LINAN|nr:TP53-regulating kinase-like [Lingula anatina]|eukprot:XP_013380275.1 TP53-regulating kinase-like [Lingula anatina]